MSYKAQLVVRARGKEGVSLIETVKEMANEQGITYSEMAVELLQRGLNADQAPAQSAASASSAPSDSASAGAKTETKKAVSAKPKSENAPLPAEEAGPAVDPKLPPKKIVKHYKERREDRGERAAARILVDFFAVAGPADGGELKKLLQNEFTNDEYEALMKPIKETEEYATYTERAIFGEPSPYSEVN